MGRRLRTDSDMTEGSIGRHLVEFAVPMAIGLLFQQLYNTVDTLVVGNFVSGASSTRWWASARAWQQELP